eukprot:scaffold8.g1466.t1
MASGKITFGARDLPGYEFGDVNDPAVVVIQEWWGITDIILGHAKRLAAAGYRTLVPDLYKGKIGVDKEEAQHLMSNLDFPGAVEEIKEAVEYLRAKGAKKVGTTGFCMGGALSLAAAQHAGVDAAAPFYGLPDPALAQPESIKVPLLLSFGELDEYKGFSDPGSAEAFAQKVNAAGGSAECIIYPQCGHGFLNTGPEAVAKRAHMGFPEPLVEQQDKAWVTLVAFLDKNLKQ